MAIYDDLDDQSSPAAHIERCRRDFESTGNPLYAWEAWGEVRFTWRSRRHDPISLPDWLGEYLDVCGHQLLGWRPERVGRSGWKLRPEKEQLRPGQGPGAISRALGFSDGLAKARKQWGGPFDRRERLALSAVELMHKEGLSLDAAAVRLDGKSTSHSAVTRAVRDAKRYALRYMQDRLREEVGKVPPRKILVRTYSNMCRRMQRKRRNRSKHRA